MRNKELRIRNMRLKTEKRTRRGKKGKEMERNGRGGMRKRGRRGDNDTEQAVIREMMRRGERIDGEERKGADMR